MKTRSKELPYLDVLSEAVNNPIRLLLGWYGIGALAFPPSSFLFAYWLIGAYLMDAKRLAEYRTIGDPEIAAQYRSSFRYYDEPKLATAMMVYGAGFMFFVGVILVKYHPEFILSLPLLLFYMGYYSMLTYAPNSIVQTPEKLFRDKKLTFFTVILVIAILLLAMVHIPGLETWLGINHAGW